MALTSGTQLGPYEVVSPLGVGGMGEVYRATDSRLDRDVAIKVLPTTMAADPERVARFQREAKVLASLNHPNVASVYGFEEANGTRFLVLEFVEGDTLGERLQGGPLPCDEALDVAKQMAEAIEAAHEKGVIHRDLKPGNVMLRPDGTVKVLDFGLAKALAEESPETTTEASPTITADFTRPGVVLGTAAYMSPEQARGRALDKRSDIWSFGVILFECLTGVRLFQGETATDSMGAIMHREPDWSLLPPGTPPTVQLLLRRCLTKDRKRRLHDIADARIELENAIVDPASTSLGLAAAAIAAGRRRVPWRWAVLTAVMFAAIGAAVGRLALPASASRVARLTLSIPPEYELSPGSTPILSRDGRSVAFVAQGLTLARSKLVMRELDQLEFRTLAGSDNASHPFFSEDGMWIAFQQDNKLKKRSVRGGPPITLCDAPSFRGGAWRSDGSIVFAPDNTGGLMLIPASGGTPEPFTTVDDADRFASHRLPSALPDGRGVLFTVAADFAAWEESAVMVVAGAGQTPKELIKVGSAAQYVEPGYLVFMREGTLMAAPFDLGRLELTGQSVPVLEEVTAPGPSRAPQFSIDAQGTLLYQTGSTRIERRLVLIDESGKEEPLGEHTGLFGEPSISPDDRYVAIELGEGSETRIAILERERDILRTLPGTAYEAEPVWSPDGRWFAMASTREGGRANLYRVRADLSGEVERLTTSEHIQVPGDWSPDGRRLVFLDISPETAGDLQLLELDENGDVTGGPKVLVDDPEWQWGAEFSPDGAWIAYVSVESGREEVFVRRSDGSGSAVQLSTAGGRYVRWSPKEEILYYLPPDPERLAMQAVKYTVEGNTFTAQAPKTIFTIQGRERYDSDYDITADGKHFVFACDVEPQATRVHREPVIVLNWTQELRSLVPSQ